MSAYLRFFLIGIFCLFTGSLSAQSKIEVGGFSGITANSNWDRNPSVTFYGGEYWLFYTKADNDGVRGVGGYNPDNETYVVWYKRSGSVASLASAPETKLSLSETARPSGFDQRLASAVAFNGNLYAFVSCGYSQAVHPVYYYKWDGSGWTGPAPLATGGAAHVNASADADRIYLAVNSYPDNADLYTWDGVLVSGPFNAGTGNIVPKVTLMNGTLYVVSIADPAWTGIEVFSGMASATPTLSYLSTPYTAGVGAMVWDPTIFNDNVNLYVAAAPQTGDAPQWLAQTYSVDGGVTWAAPKRISSGGNGSANWWDFWPNGYFDGTDKYLFFSTEGNGSSFGDAEIASVKMDWDLSNDHSFYIQNGIDLAITSDTVDVALGTYEGFSVSGKAGLTVRGKGNGTIVHPTALIATGIGHKYDADMSVSIFVNNSTNVNIQNLKIEDNGVTPCGAGTPNAIVFWNASTGMIEDCYIHGTYAIGGCQTGQGLAVDAGSGQISVLNIVNTNIDGIQKNAIDAVDGNSLTGNPGSITVNVMGGTISGAGPTSAIAQNGILFWNRGGGNVGGAVDGVTIANLEYALPGTTASGIITSGDAVNVSNCIFAGVQRYLASMGAGAVIASDNNSFDGINPLTATPVQLALLEDRIDHKMDDGSLGFISFKPGWVIATVNNLGIGQGYGITSAGTTLLIGPGIFQPATTIALNKSDVTITGAGTASTIIKTSVGVGNLFNVTGSGTSIENLQIEKTDKAGVQNIILINANDVTIRNNLIWGKYVLGDGDVSRAMVVAGGLTGLLIEGNTIYALRQPAYFSNSSGSVLNNLVYGTRGWVIEDGNFNFTGNSWGTGTSANYLDIAILAMVNPAYYTDIVAMSGANNDAVIEDQRYNPKVLSIVYVDSAAAAGGDGTILNPYQAISPAITRVVPSGTVHVAKGTYNEDVIIGKGLKLFSTDGRDRTIVNGQLSGWGGGALRINSSDVTVGGAGRGFTFNSLSGGSGLLLTAFYVSSARNNLLIEENKFVAAPRDPGNNESYALLTEGGQTNHTYLNNIFDGLSAPRFLVYVNGFADVGVHSVNIDFIGNYFVSASGGLSLSSESGEISGNFFQGAAGIGLSQYSPNAISGNHFEGTGNHVSLNTLSGVGMDGVISSNEFIGKVVVRNGSGYRIESFAWGDYVTLRGNIQKAVDAALAGDSVLVSDETYEEQVEISKEIILRGQSMAGTIIKSPLTLEKFYMTSVNNYPVVYVHDVAGAEISNLTIDGAGRGNGNYRFQGVGFRNAGGRVEGCLIKDIRETPINGNQHGVGIYAYADNGTARVLHANGNTIEGFQKNGTAFNGPDLTVSADDNLIVGAGPVDFIAQNCLQIGFGATGSLTNNEIGSVSYTPGTDVSCGMLLYQSGGTIQTRGNTVTNAQVGINYINVGGEIKHNNITASAAGVGTASFWGIVADPGDKERIRVQPFDNPPAGTAKTVSRVNSVSSISTVADSNTLIGDGVNGIGMEVDALGTETLNFSAIENTVANWGRGIVFYKEAGAALNSVLRRNSITGNRFGILDQTGALQDAKENYWGSPSGPADAKTLPGTPDYNNLAGTGDSVSSFIDYNPWYIDPLKTTLSIYTLTVSALHGTVGRLPDQGTYNHGSLVQLTPAAEPGYHFVSWSGDVPPGDETDNPLTLLMDRSRSVTATFVADPVYTITATAGPNGTITPSGILTFGEGDDQSFAIAPDPHYHIDSVFVDGIYVGQLSSYAFSEINADHTIHAVFAIDQFSLSVAVVGNGSVTADPERSWYDYNSSLDLLATPALGWNFSRWEGDASGSENPLHLTIDGNKSVTAVFAEDSLYLVSYRSFSAESLALDKDNKGKFCKYVLKKPVRTKFSAVLVNSTGKKQSILHLHFHGRLIVSDPQYPFILDPAPSSVTFMKTNTIVTPIWNDSLAEGDSLKIEGWSNIAKPMRICYSWRTFGGGEHPELTPVANQIYLPMPNRLNAVYESFRLGGFTPTAGLTVGLNRREGVDSSKYYSWLQSKKCADLLKTLTTRNGSQIHTGTPRGFDKFNNGRKLAGPSKTLSPDKYNNSLLAGMIALKVNVISSRLGITTRGFGELIFDDGSSNPLNGLMLKEIGDYGDALMSGRYDAVSRGRLFESEASFINLAAVIGLVNAAFEGAVDTLSFVDSLVYRGSRQLKEIPFLRANPLVMPSQMPPLAERLESFPNRYSLGQNYPNPFNPVTLIRFDLPEDGIVSLKVFNTLGQLVALLLDRQMADAGENEVEFSADRLASGVYFYSLEVEPAAWEEGSSDSFKEVKKMVLLR